MASSKEEMEDMRKELSAMKKDLSENLKSLLEQSLERKGDVVEVGKAASEKRDRAESADRMPAAKKGKPNFDFRLEKLHSFHGLHSRITF